MGGIGKRTAAAGLVIAAALIAGLGWYIAHTQEQARATVRDNLERRAALTGRLVGGALTATTANAARAQYGGSAAEVRRRIAQGHGRPGRRTVVLDTAGRVIAASAPGLVRDRGLVARSPHLRAALRGTTALSDAFRDSTGRWLIEVAVPFQTRSGQRVVAGSAPREVVREFAGGFFATASALQGSQGFLLDGAGRTLSTTVAPAGVLFVGLAFAVCALLVTALVAVGRGRRLAAAYERERAAHRLAHERLHDTLTGLPNRTLFEDRAEHAITAAHRRGRSVAVVFLDLDHFKRINDSFGHTAGDAVLREVAGRLERSVRAADTVSRFGGDEFIVLCEEITDNEVLCVVSRLQHDLTGPVSVGGRSVPVTFSIGVAVHNPGDQPRKAADLVQDADTAMYRAKDRGRARIEVFDSDLHRDAVERLDAEVALRRAIDEEELVVFYQPIVTLPDGGIGGVEALVRWRRPQTGELVPPGEFIPLAEETGLIADLGDWVLRTAVREIGDWARRGLIDDTFDLSVNVSARQLSDPALPDTVRGALAGWDRPASRLCLEITETAVMSDPGAAEEMLERLQAVGVRLALDDFGVGHSSLGQLARLMPISVLKLDRSFVAAMTGPRDRGIVEAAASLARALNLSSIAEGVETPEQAAELAGMGFPLAQGFLFGRPTGGEQLVARLQRTRAPRNDEPLVPRAR